MDFLAQKPAPPIFPVSVGDTKTPGFILDLSHSLKLYMQSINHLFAQPSLSWLLTVCKNNHKLSNMISNYLHCYKSKP